MLNHILISPSSNLITILNSFSHCSSPPENIGSYFEDSRNGDNEKLCLTTVDIKWIHNKLRQEKSSVRIHQLIAESYIMLPKYEDPPRSSELEERVQRLKREQECRDYQSMTRNVDFVIQQRSEFSDMGHDFREVNRQLVTGLQYFVSIVGTFFAIFIGMGLVTTDYGTRALFATICAAVVGLSEIYFIIRDDIRKEIEQQKIDDHKNKKFK